MMVKAETSTWTGADDRNHDDMGHFLVALWSYEYSPPGMGDHAGNWTTHNYPAFNWKDTQEAEIIATTFPPGDDLESAILADLNPGAYTVILRGKNRPPESPWWKLTISSD